MGENEMHAKDGIWEGDRLDREAEAAQLATFLRNRSAEFVKRKEPRAFVLNIDARWGDGKTFFLTRLRDQLADQGHIAVYVDAWGDDFAEDPLTAVMAAIDDEVLTRLPRRSPAAKLWKQTTASAGKVSRLVAKGVAMRALSLALTSGVATAVDAAWQDAGEQAEGRSRGDRAGSAVAKEAVTAFERVLDERAEESIDVFRGQKKSLRTFRETLSSFIIETEKLRGVAPPFFVLIDELDRCRPLYAIAMLERVKHLFDTPHVVFVIATDSGQLRHSVGAIYGSGFASDRYLRRFFDRTYVFAKPGLNEFVAQLLRGYPLDDDILSSPFDDEHHSFISDFFTSIDLDLRSTGQIFEMLRTVASSWNSDARIQLVLMLPLLVGFHQDPSNLTNRKSIRSYLDQMHLPMRLSYRSGDVFKHQMNHVSVKELAQAVWDDAQRPLSDLVVGEVHSLPTSWRQRQWSDELRQLHGNVFRSGAPLTSIVQSYPSMILQAGRLRRADDMDDREED
jgi:hypothetical protein